MREVAETRPADPLARAQLIDLIRRSTGAAGNPNRAIEPTDRLDVAVGRPEGGFTGLRRDGFVDPSVRRCPRPRCGASVRSWLFSCWLRCFSIGRVASSRRPSWRRSASRLRLIWRLTIGCARRITRPYPPVTRRLYPRPGALGFDAIGDPHRKRRLDRLHDQETVRDVLDDPQHVVDPPTHEPGHSMGLGADAHRCGRRVDALDPGDPLGVVVRIEHVRGDVFWRPGDVGLDADIERHGLLLVLAVAIVATLAHLFK